MDDITKFQIDPKIKEKYSQLITLVLQTQSMSEDEKKYWFQLLPTMTKDQIENLQGILEREKQKLGAIDKKYKKKIEEISNKYVVKWKGVKIREKREKIRKAETAAKEEEITKEEEILSQLEDI